MRGKPGLLLTENDMADLATATFALHGLWTWLHAGASHRPPCLETFDRVDGELRAIEAGLAAGRRSLQRERERV